MALLSVVKLELNKGVNNMGFGSGAGIGKAINLVSSVGKEKIVTAMKDAALAKKNGSVAGIGSALKKAMGNAGLLKTKTTATAKPAMRYAPLDLSDTGGPSLNLKNKKALNPSLQAPMTLYDRQMLKGK